jgi:hypothetical protein
MESCRWIPTELVSDLVHVIVRCWQRALLHCLACWFLMHALVLWMSLELVLLKALYCYCYMVQELPEHPVGGHSLCQLLLAIQLSCWALSKPWTQLAQ